MTACARSSSRRCSNSVRRNEQGNARRAPEDASVEFNQDQARMHAMVANPKDIARHYYSLEEYFALEHVGDARYEYWNGDIFCMSGGTRQHGRISSNAHRMLAN